MAENRKPFSIPKDGGLPILDENTSVSVAPTSFPEGKSIFYADSTEWDSQPSLIITDKIDDIANQMWAKAGSARQISMERVGGPIGTEYSVYTLYENYPDGFVLPTTTLTYPAPNIWTIDDISGYEVKDGTLRAVSNLNSTNYSLRNSTWSLYGNHRLRAWDPGWSVTADLEYFGWNYSPSDPLGGFSYPHFNLGLEVFILSHYSGIEYSRSFDRFHVTAAASNEILPRPAGWVKGDPVYNIKVRMSGVAANTVRWEVNWEDQGWVQISQQTVANTSVPGGFPGYPTTTSPGYIFYFKPWYYDGVFTLDDTQPNACGRIRKIEIVSDSSHWAVNPLGTVTTYGWGPWHNTDKDEWEIKTTANTSELLELNKKYFVDTVDGTCDLVMPQNPIVGDFIEIVDMRQTFHNNHCSVIFQYNPFENDPLAILVFKPETQRETHCKLTYTGPDIGWKITKDL